MQFRVLLFVFALFSNTAFCQYYIVVPSSQSISSIFPEFVGWHNGLQANGLITQNATLFSLRPPHIDQFQGSVDGYIAPLHTGIGGSVSHEKYGSRTITVYDFAITPRLRLNVKGSPLTILPSLGFTHSIFTSEYRKSSDFFVDPIISEKKYNGTATRISIGTGFVYKSWFGAFHFRDNAELLNGLFPKNRFTYRHINTYNFFISRIFEYKKVMITPSLAFKTDIASMDLIANLNLQYKWLYTGISYQAFNSVTLAAGAELKSRYRISYAFELHTSLINAYGFSSGTHVLGLRTLLFSKPETRLIKSIPLL